MAEHLSPLDAMFLELEQADESAHMHIGAVMVFGPTPRGVPTLADLADRLEERLQPLQRYRQKLSSARTGGLSWPTWEADRRFDIRDHLRRAVLPPPGADAELADWIGDFYSHRLDRSRPLWEAVLLEGLEDGRWALATKTHHCMVDGIASVDVGRVLLDEERKPSARTRPSAGPSQEAEDPWSTPGVVLRGARAGLSAAVHPRTLLSRTRATLEMLIREELVAAPTTSLNQPIGGTRRYEPVRIPLEELGVIRRALGGTVNDIVLALCAGGLRRLLLSRGEKLPPDGLRGQVPVNIREASEHLALGNRLVSLFVHLPVTDSDPLRRYRAVVSEAEHRKHGTQALAAKTLIDITSLAPPALHTVLAQSLFDVRLFNVTITNVPAAPKTLYAFGAPLVEVLPLVPLFARHAVGIAAVSYAGDMVLGLNADRGSVPDLDVLADGLRESLAELKAVVQTRTPTSGRQVRARPASSARPASARSAGARSIRARRGSGGRG